MSGPALASLAPRRRPQQQRSRVTLGFILEAAIQVLLEHGLAAFTTTRVAQRAGISVGSLYQYFPNKQALLYGMLEQHLTGLAETLEASAAACRGQPVMTAATTLIDTYIAFKTEQTAATRALYKVSSELDDHSLIDAISNRISAVFTTTLRSAPDARFADVDAVSFMLRTALVGAARSVLEHGAKPEELVTLRRELRVLCLAYLAAAAQ
jgi:AcrR family transcriptional regulator